MPSKGTLINNLFHSKHSSDLLNLERENMKHHRNKTIKSVFVAAGITGLVIYITPPLTAQFLANETSSHSSNHRHLDVNRFTKIGGNWPPQPKNMENIVWLRDSSLVRSNSIINVGEIEKNLATNVSELGDRFTFVSTKSADEKNSSSSEKTATFFSHSNNTTVKVRTDQGSIKEIVEISPSQYQPPLTVEEVKDAVKIARESLQNDGFSRIQQLEGYGILAFKPSSELASGETGFYDTRVVYVSFHEHIDARPEFIAWVDLTEESVIKSREDKL